MKETLAFYCKISELMIHFNYIYYYSTELAVNYVHYCLFLSKNILKCFVYMVDSLINKH